MEKLFSMGTVVPRLKMAHLKRQGNKTYSAIKFNENTKYLGNQNEFLKNASNRERFIEMICLPKMKVVTP